MSVSIVSCPSCKSLILSDTAQCPTCQHVIKPEKAAIITQDLPAVGRAAGDVVECPDCGEEVRSGLVRCWRCGGFLRGDIAESYEKMLDAPQAAAYPDGPHDLEEIGEEETEIASADDFVLGDGLDFLSPEQAAHQQSVLDQELPDLDDLDVAGEPAIARDETASEPAAEKPDDQSPVPDEGDTYGLPSRSEPEAESGDDPDSPPDSGLAAKKSKEKRKEKKAAPTDDDAAEGDDVEEAPVSTGDPLLDIALQEEREAQKRIKKAKRDKAKARRKAGAMAGFVAVFCPNGHRIHVDEKYRGLTGRCPKCKSMFLVPALDWQAELRAKQEAENATTMVSRYSNWSLDLHLHKLDPAKLKLKPGSLAGAFQEADVCFTDDGILMVVHGKQNAGLFAGEKNKKKKEELRVEVQEHLRLEKELLDLPAAGYRFYGPDDIKKSQVVQPAIYVHESMFAGVPVFGPGRAAVRLPVTAADQDTQDIMFLSFHLTEFREFSKQLGEKFEVPDLGQAEGVPLSDSPSKHKCHYSDRALKSIEVTEFHQADKDMDLELIGRKCQACGLVVSEDSRKKEKLGGATGKGIAKAKCPKCEQKFGNLSLFGLKTEEEEPDTSMSETGGMPTRA